VLVVQAESQPNQPSTVQRFFVIEDDQELSGADIENPEQSVDSRTNEPVITMEFTEAGRKAFARATKREATRGTELQAPPDTSRDQAFQHFAIVVDGEVLSLAAIDFLENPEGIDGRNGAQLQGLGTVEETKLLTIALKVGALPADPTLVSQRRRG
jgi:preprotein translocase subunit SecD